MSVSIDSNKSSGYYKEESALGIPGSGPWYAIEPNTYSDFGGDLKTVARQTINATRQRSKGTVTDLDVTAGWSEDLTQNNLTRLIQGFLMAAARVKPSTQPVTVPETTYTPLAAVAASQKLTGANFTALGFKVGHIVKTRRALNAANNFVWYVTAVTNADITLSPVESISNTVDNIHYTAATSALVDEAAAGPGIIVEAVGFRLPLANAPTLNNLTNNGRIRLTATGGGSFDLTTLSLIAGETIYLGDNNTLNATTPAGPGFLDSSGNQVRGYARIAVITAGYIEFDVVSGLVGAASNTAAASATYGGANIYFGAVNQNEMNPSLITRFSYTLARTLGVGIEGAIYETVLGAVPNQFTLNIPSNNKATCDLTFVGIDNQQTVGTIAGQPALNEDPINTSQDMFAMLLYVINATNSKQTPLFGYASDEKITINNNVKPNKAIGVVGGFEVSTGNFDVSGSLTCYFDSIQAIKAIRQNADVGLFNILAKKNAGMVFDLPLLTLGGGRLKIELNTPIMADITHEAAAGVNNVTLVITKFPYLPSAAMQTYAAPTA